MFFVKLQTAPGKGALKHRAQIATCFVKTKSALVAAERVRRRLADGEWEAGEVMEIRPVRRSSCMEDQELLEHYDLAETAGIAVRLHTWTFQWPSVTLRKGERAV
jgi:hypothetical protein